MADDNTTPNEQEVPEEGPTNAPESRWSKLDELESKPRQSKRAGFVDVMTGGDDEHPIHPAPTG
jgi:hypothetical protein